MWVQKGRGKVGLSGNILVKGGAKYVIQYLYSFVLVLGKRQTLNKAPIHAIVNYD